MASKRPPTKQLSREIEKLQVALNSFLASPSSKLLMQGVENYAKTDKLTKIALSEFSKSRDDFKYTLNHLRNHLNAIEEKTNVEGL